MQMPDGTGDDSSDGLNDARSVKLINLNSKWSVKSTYANRHMQIDICFKRDTSKVVDLLRAITKTERC